MMEKIPFLDDTIPSLIKSNTLIKVPCLTDWCVTKFLLTFESTKVQTPESIWAYLTMRFWRWGHRDIDTVRVVNQDVKHEIFQDTYWGPYLLCRIILINTPCSMSKQVEIYYHESRWIILKAIQFSKATWNHWISLHHHLKSLITISTIDYNSHFSGKYFDIKLAFMSVLKLKCL